MIWSPELEETHRDLSETDLLFRRFVSQDPESLSRSSFKALDVPSPLLKYKLQSWPTFVGPEKVREIERASVGMSSLIRGIPERVFGGDPRRVAEHYGTDPLSTELLLSPPNGIDSAVSRGDFVDTPQGLKCVEFNMSAHLGGWETSILAGIQVNLSPIRRFLRQHGVTVTFRNTVREIFRHVAREAERQGLTAEGELNVAVVMPVLSAQDVAMISPYLDGEYRPALEEHGLRGRAFLCDYSQLSERLGRLYYGALKVGAVVERSSTHENRMAFNCFKAGALCFFNSPVAMLLGDKRNLALLSELEGSPIFSDEERAILERHLPWTRRVERGEATYRGERISLLDFISSRRESLVLKKARSLGGADVLIGRFTSQEEWETVLAREATGNDWIVQEYVESRPYLFQNDEHGCSPHDAVWGPFVFGNTYAGAFLRLQPKRLLGIVNLTRGATEGVLLEVAR